MIVFYTVLWTVAACGLIGIPIHHWRTRELRDRIERFIQINREQAEHNHNAMQKLRAESFEREQHKYNVGFIGGAAYAATHSSPATFHCN